MLLQTLEGECDVAYSITQEGGRTIVSKSVNFEKCSRTPEAIYGRRFSKKATDHKVFIPQTVYTYKFDKEELKEISVRSIYGLFLGWWEGKCWGGGGWIVSGAILIL